MEIPRELIQALRSGNAVLFIGADLPRELTGMPSRADLAAALATHLGDGDPPPSWPDIAAQYKAQAGLHALIRWLQDQLETAGAPPGPIHALLARLPVGTYISTTYDDRLHKALVDAERRPNLPVVGVDSLGLLQTGRPTVVKLFGLRDRPDSLALTSDDLQTLAQSKAPLLTGLVQPSLANHSVLILGQDLRDPYFQILYQTALAHAGSIRPMAYAIAGELAAWEREAWRRRGVHVIEAPVLDVLDALLADLAGSPGSGERAGVTPAIPPLAGDEPPRRARPAERPQSPAVVPFSLQLTDRTGGEFEVRALQSPMGEARETTHLAYTPEQLVAILKALQAGSLEAADLKPEQFDALRRLGLLGETGPAPDLAARVGRALHATLLPGQAGRAFQLAFNQARRARAAIALQLRFDADAVELARYPWELLHDGERHLLSGGAVELTRYISYPEAPTSLAVAPPWRLLYIGPRPPALGPLPRDAERTAVWDGLGALVETGKLALERLDPPTYDALVDRMATAEPHILHFDGHGLFARRCPACGTMHYPHVPVCAECATLLDGVPPSGYLAFEGEAGAADYVSTAALENVLLTSQVRLVTLSACQSATVRGGSLFGGLGPGLIRAGVPAVLAMQFAVPVKAATDFSRAFYTTLAGGHTLPRAVAQGRRRLFRGGYWFTPALYLRGGHDEARLFVE